MGKIKHFHPLQWTMPCQGFTLLEIVLVLMIIGIIAIGASLGLFQAIQGYIFTEKNIESVVASDDLKGMAIRLAKIYKIKTISNSREFTYTTLTNNGTAISNSSVSAFRAPLGSTIEYLDANGTATNNVDDVRYIVLCQNATVGDNTSRTYRLRIAPYHLNYHQ